MNRAPRTLRFRYPMLAAALAAALFAAPLAAQTTDPEATPPADPVPVVIEDRSLRSRTAARDLVLGETLAVTDAAGNTLVTLPAGTRIGRERNETRFAAEDQPIRQRTDLRGVRLEAPTTITDRRSGETIELPAGTILRVRLDQRLDGDGNIVRDRIDLRAVQPDGTRLRIRDRAPETAVIERENEATDNHRQRGRDVARAEDRPPRVERADRSGRRDGRAERVERPERPERPERSGSGRGGGNSGPG
jgi:hypothetical protein